MDRRRFIQGIVGIGASIALHRFIPMAWAVDHGIYTGPSYLLSTLAKATINVYDYKSVDGMAFYHDDHRNHMIRLFIKELRKFPKSSWVHSIRDVKVISHEDSFTEEIRCCSVYPEGNHKKYLGFVLVGGVNSFQIKDIRVSAAKKTAENLDHAWRQTFCHV